MKARLDVICRIISRAFDAIDREMFGISQHHSLRLAVLTAAMGRHLSYDDEHVMALALSALFHDSALGEHYLSECVVGQATDIRECNMRAHCEKGQATIDELPLAHCADDYVLYHHECADGSGVFGKKEGEYPLEADFLSMADSIDLSFDLQTLALEDLPKVREAAGQMRGHLHSDLSVDAFLAIFTEEMLISLREDNIIETLHAAIPCQYVDLGDPSIILLADVNARAIDYKSSFTRKHTNQIANRTYMMCDYYGYNTLDKQVMYLAAGLHDIGKAQVPAAILEKQGKLSNEEFKIIKSHVYYTYIWLKEVPGFEDICRWAGGHHEKLDGRGYPFGLTGEDIDFNARLLGCIDIYQAVSEARPYHDPRSHEDTMKIMYEMVEEGKIDPDITRDLDKVMAPWSFKDVPYPYVQQT